GGDPGAHELAESVGGDPQHPPGAGASSRREIAACVVPCRETAGPQTRSVHRPHHDSFFPSRPAREIDPALEEHPPEVRWIAFAEQLLVVCESNFLADCSQFAQLLVAESVE